MKSLRIELEPDIHKDLKLQAVKNGTTVSELVRDAIMELIQPTHQTPALGKTPAAIGAIARGKLDTIGDLNIMCKNGHLLGKFGKCMEKGCKYS